MLSAKARKACASALVQFVAGGALLLQGATAVYAAPASINSTGQGRASNSSTTVPLQSKTPGGVAGNYSVMVSNDLGMHCADFDTRIATILPLFNVLHAQIIKKGSQPTILDNSSVSVQYSAVSNPSDPVGSLTPSKSAASFGTLAPNGSVFKTNFWDNISAYKSFYPSNLQLSSYFPSITSTSGAKNYDVGLPVPDVYTAYLSANGGLVVNQQTNPSVTAFSYQASTPLLHLPSLVSSSPYTANKPQPFRTFEPSYPVFSGYFGSSFGYVAQNTKWFAAEGIPMTPFDDYGRENPFPMMRVEAISKTTPTTKYASTDVVVPISGETSCKSCHLPSGAGGDGTATKTTYGISWVTAANDPAYKNGQSTGTVPRYVAEEWAADINILKLHDYLHPLSGNLDKRKLFNGYDTQTGKPVDALGAPSKGIACQTCHYTPALDLAQLGPQGSDGSPAGNQADYAWPDPATKVIPDGLMQTTHETMSRVMHFAHGMKASVATMPAPPRALTSTGAISSSTQQALENSCYQCHPGKRTKCLRGAMYSEAGSVCQDCHGSMAQIGDDFSRDVVKNGASAWIARSDYYTSASTPRVPWLNEPTCGSCHTGDANSNFAKSPPGGHKVIPASSATTSVDDSIRLLQAYFSDDVNAKPIIPTNKRFAEPVVLSGAAAGNPQLFRLSVDSHGGVFCEGCHGATHAEWPAGDGSTQVNDNVAANQLQGHTGKIMECNTCHTGTSMGNTLKGPHGMHPVGNNGFSAAWVNGHEDFAERNIAECKACHGTNGLGTVLSEVAVDRVGLRCEHTGPRADSPPCTNGKITLKKNYKVTCDTCHENKAR